MGIIIENQRLKKIIIKHHSKKVQDYYNSTTSEREKDNRSNAIKFYEIGACKFEDLPMVEATIGRIFGEFKRAGIGTYSDVEVLYQNVLEAAFAYFVDNHDYFYVRTKLAFADGIDKYELHRREQHYTSSSVFWLLITEHDEVHSPYYFVKYHKDNYLVRDKYTNKEQIQKEFGLSRKKMKLALEQGFFMFGDIKVYVHKVESAIEPSFEEHLNSTRRLLESQVKIFNDTEDLTEKMSLMQSINKTLNDGMTYERLLKEDRAYNERMKQFKGKSAIDLWNQKAMELNERYKTNSANNK